MKGGWVDRKSIPRGPNGRGMCRWCSLEVPHRRFTFCSEFCVHEWKLRTQPAYLREKVFERDRGICADCGVDTISAAWKLRFSRGSSRSSLLAHWGLRTRSRKSLWDADHIVPVIEGEAESATSRTSAPYVCVVIEGQRLRSENALVVQVILRAKKQISRPHGSKPLTGFTASIVMGVVPRNSLKW